MHTYKLANSIFDGPITNLLSILCILIEVLLRAHEKGWMAGWGGSRNHFMFDNFTGLFPSEKQQ